MTASAPVSANAPAVREPRVVCLILNFNRPDDTLTCLASLAEGQYRNYHAVVLDVGSGEALAAPMRARYPEASLAPIAENAGYAGNNNFGLRLAAAYDPEWVFLLNDDTRLAPDCLAQLMAVAAANETAGILGPTVAHATHPGLIQSAGGRLTAGWEAEHPDRNAPLPDQPGEPRPAAWLVGCALLVRWRVIQETGSLDERFFMYYEEVDWCLRIQERGWRCLHVPRALVWHKGVSPDYRPGPAVTYYSARNRLLLMSKHGAPIAAKALAWATFLRTWLSWSLRPRWRSKRLHRQALWQALADYARGRLGERAVPGA